MLLKAHYTWRVRRQREIEVNKSQNEWTTVLVFQMARFYSMNAMHLSACTCSVLFLLLIFKYQTESQWKFEIKMQRNANATWSVGGHVLCAALLRLLSSPFFTPHLFHSALSSSPSQSRLPSSSSSSLWSQKFVFSTWLHCCKFATT